MGMKAWIVIEMEMNRTKAMVVARMNTEMDTKTMMVTWIKIKMMLHRETTMFGRAMIGMRSRMEMTLNGQKKSKNRKTRDKRKNKLQMKEADDLMIVREVLTILKI